jgi:DhnA family fructose-bisphosphate aldolase class Ia
MTHNPRLHRLFGSDGKCFDVALDHGVFHVPEFLAGIEDLPRAVDMLVEAGPDAIQLGPGQAHLLQSRTGRSKPALVLRGDTGNVYGPARPRDLFCLLNANPVEQALRVGAITRDAIAQFLLPREDWRLTTFSLEGHPHLRHVRVATADVRQYGELLGGVR